MRKHAAEILRNLRNHKYEESDNGIYMPSMHATVGGAMSTAHRPAGGEFGPWEVSHNKIPAEGLIYMVGAACAAAHVPAIDQFYIAPFSGNVTPDDNWKGSNFAALATEFTAYTAAGRLPWNVEAPATTPTVSNGAAVAAATLTFAPGGPYNLYGAAVLEASGKGATTGKLLMAVRFGSSRLNMAAGDDLAFSYAIALTDAG